MSSQPKIAAKEPAKVELVSHKKYAFCACGQSADQPFCDGSHQGTSFKPLLFSVDEGKTAFLCQCKNSENQPYCDGTHNKL